MADDSIKRVRVECHAGYRENEEPRVLWVDEERHQVVGIRDRWYSPDGDYFKVCTHTGWVVLVKQDRDSGTWWMIKQEMMDG